MATLLDSVISHTHTMLVVLSLNPFIVVVDDVTDQLVTRHTTLPTQTTRHGLTTVSGATT